MSNFEMSGNVAGVIQNSIKMSESKTFVFPESGNGGGSGMLAMLAPLLQQKGIDPNLLVAMQGRNNNGFGGEGGWFIWVIFLFFLMGWGNNGWGNGGFGGGIESYFMTHNKDIYIDLY